MKATLRYTSTAIVLHWLIALVLFANSVIGVIAANFVEVAVRRQLLNFHKPLGIALLGLIVLRIAWRLFNHPPKLPDMLADWEVRASEWSHRVLYGVMLMLPLSGWLLTSAAVRPHPIEFGPWVVPFLAVPRSAALAELAHTAHVLASIALGILVALHVGAVINHARRGTSVLPRMLFQRSSAGRPDASRDVCRRSRVLRAEGRASADCTPHQAGDCHMLTLDLAERIADGVLRAARERNTMPMAVMILDAGGHPVVFKREDGASLFRFDIARAKAMGALGMGADTRDLATRAAGNPTFFLSVAMATGGSLAFSPGGVLIRNAAGQTIGAVGISGDVGDVDEDCAKIAIDQACVGGAGQ